MLSMRAAFLPFLVILVQDVSSAHNMPTSVSNLCLWFLFRAGNQLLRFQTNLFWVKSALNQFNIGGMREIEGISTNKETV